MMNLAEADVIVSGGRGMGSPANFALLEELAATVEAAPTEATGSKQKLR